MEYDRVKSTNKSERTTPFMKVVIVVFAAILVITLMLPSLSALFAPAKEESAQKQSEETSQSAEAENQTPQSAQDVDNVFRPAADALKKRLEEKPDNVALLNDLSSLYFNWGIQLMPFAKDQATLGHMQQVFSTAAETYDKLLGISPSDTVTVDKNLSLFYAGKSDEALKGLEELTKKSPDFASAWANLGMVYETEGRADDAKSAYKKAIEVNKEDNSRVKLYAESRLEALEKSNETSASANTTSTK